MSAKPPEWVKVTKGKYYSSNKVCAIEILGGPPYSKIECATSYRGQSIPPKWIKFDLTEWLKNAEKDLKKDRAELQKFIKQREEELKEGMDLDISKYAIEETTKEVLLDEEFIKALKSELPKYTNVELPRRFESWTPK